MVSIEYRISACSIFAPLLNETHITLWEERGKYDAIDTFLATATTYEVVQRIPYAGSCPVCTTQVLTGRGLDFDMLSTQSNQLS